MTPKIIDKESRRRDILAAAATVFAKFGYQRASIDRIAEAAGVAKGSVYLAFDSKEDLFYALFESSVRDAIYKKLFERDAPERRSLDRVADLLLGALQLVDEEESTIPLTLEFWSVCGVEETRHRFGRRYLELLDEFRDGLVGLLAQAQSEGDLPKNAPLHEIASCLIAMTDGLLVQQWMSPDIHAYKILHKALPHFLGSFKAD